MDKCDKLQLNRELFIISAFSQNIPSWKRPLKIIESNSQLCRVANPNPMSERIQQLGAVPTSLGSLIHSSLSPGEEPHVFLPFPSKLPS